MSYQTGMLVWGASKSIGNIWVVTDGVNRTISLVFDGKNKRFCPDYKLTKHDTVSATSYLYELTLHESNQLTIVHGSLPKWALDFIGLYTPTNNGLPRAKASLTATLAPAVVQKVQRALGVNLTAEPERVILRKDDTKCINGNEHRYVDYTGLVQSFEYCIHCDAKRWSTN